MVMIVATICILIRRREHVLRKQEEVKQNLMQSAQVLKEKSEQLSIHNKYTAVLAHEMRNFVTK